MSKATTNTKPTPVSVKKYLALPKDVVIANATKSVLFTSYSCTSCDSSDLFESWNYSKRPVWCIECYHLLRGGGGAVSACMLEHEQD